MRKISIIFSIVLIVNICFCVQSHCYAKIFSNSRSIIELWYPDNFYPVKPVISNTIGAFTDGKTGSLIISGIEYPQLKLVGVIGLMNTVWNILENVLMIIIQTNT